MTPRVNSLLVMFLFLCLSVTAEATTYTGVFSVDSIQVQPGAKFAVALRLKNNNVAVSALTVPMHYNDPSLTLDSVSFAGSILPVNFTPLVNNDLTSKTIQISYLANYENPLPTMTTSGGVIARLFFAVSSSAVPATIVIDSVNKDTVIGGVHVPTHVEVSDNTGLPTGFFMPPFIKGAVKVLVPTDVDDNRVNLPLAFGLSQNYPNPFNPTTTISFSLPSAGLVKLEVFNVLGQLISTAIDRRLEAGAHQVEFNASALPSGIYFYRLSSPFGTETRKMVLLK